MVDSAPSGGTSVSETVSVSDVSDNHEALALIMKLEAPNEVHKTDGRKGPGVQQGLRDSLHKATKMTVRSC